MPRSAGEMPFLDHLEELRSRILRSLLAVVGCFGLGIWLVNRFHLVDVIKQPIAQYLPDGRLTVLSPTEPLMILFKMGFILGLVLASPILLWQLWAFLSPALYEKEKKTMVPALFVGLGLFLAAFGLYAVTSQAVALRVREIGIRIALGARASTVAALFVRESLSLCAIGLAIGTVLSLAVSGVIGAFLFGLAPSDVLTYVGATAVFVGVAGLATLIPARRAASVDPLKSLRSE